MTAFQVNAFQADAFQADVDAEADVEVAISSDVFGGAPVRRRRRPPPVPARPRPQPILGYADIVLPMLLAQGRLHITPPAVAITAADLLLLSLRSSGEMVFSGMSDEDLLMLLLE